LLDKDGHPKNLRQGLIVDSLATLGAGVAGTSSGTAYIESIAGIRMGGRRGMTSVFTALCFLPCFFIAPIAGMVPPFATAAVLILVGAAMFTSIGKIDFSKIEEGVPAFLTLILIPLTFSITQGILWGLHLTRWVVPDGWSSSRHSSGDVCPGAGVDRTCWCWND
jgi:AGZA family xanthine/uracil permease-like MFS transporter